MTNDISCDFASIKCKGFLWFMHFLIIREILTIERCLVKPWFWLMINYWSRHVLKSYFGQENDLSTCYGSWIVMKLTMNLHSKEYHVIKKFQKVFLPKSVNLLVKHAFKRFMNNLNWFCLRKNKKINWGDLINVKFA